MVTDQASKWWAVSVLEGADPEGFQYGFFSFHLLRNPGAAFSFGEGATWVFTAIAVLAVLFIGWWAYRGNLQSYWLALWLGLIAGGAVGNLIDRLSQPPGFARGYVIDFIDYGGWFVGNVADIWIVAGAAGLVLYFLLQPAEKETAGTKKAADE